MSVSEQWRLFVGSQDQKDKDSVTVKSRFGIQGSVIQHRTVKWVFCTALHKPSDLFIPMCFLFMK